MPSEHMNKEIQAWMKRLNRKGPFYLFQTDVVEISKAVWRPNPEDGVTHYEKTQGNLYVVIYNDKEKTKIGYVKDGMYCRYGIQTMGVLSGDSMLDLWQSGPGSVTENMFNAMLDVRNNKSTLEQFKLETLKYLMH